MSFQTNDGDVLNLPLLARGQRVVVHLTRTNQHAADARQLDTRGIVDHFAE